MLKKPAQDFLFPKIEKGKILKKGGHSKSRVWQHWALSPALPEPSPSPPSPPPPRPPLYPSASPSSSPREEEKAATRVSLAGLRCARRPRRPGASAPTAPRLRRLASSSWAAAAAEKP
ncbi:hypothetical protein ABZP36_034373 [Zizania latifolia]